MKNRARPVSKSETERLLPMRLLCLSFIVLILLFTYPSLGQAVEETSQSVADLVIISGGEEIVYKEAVLITGSTVYAPLRDLANHFGVGMYSLLGGEQVKVLHGPHVTTLKLGSSVALIDEREFSMDSPMISSDGRFLVSLWSIAAILGVDAYFSDDRSRAIVERGLPRLEGVSFVRLTDGRQRLVLETTRPVEFRDFILQEPDRYVIDLLNTRIGAFSDRTLAPMDDDVLKSVRMSQFDEATARVVLDLSRGWRYTLRRDQSDQRRINVDSTFRIFGAELRPTADGGEIVVLADGGPLRYSYSYLLLPDRIVLDVQESTLVGDPSEIVCDHHLVSRVRTSQFLPGVVRIVADMKKPYPFTPYIPHDSPEQIRVAFGTMIQGITIDEHSSGVDITVRASESIRPSVRYWPDPHRIAVDFEDAFFNLGAEDLSPRSSMIDRIRTGRFQADVIRLVFDLSSYYGYSLEKGKDDREIVIRLAKSALHGRTIVIDPGHGGADPGASRLLERGGNSTLILEKDVALSQSLKLYQVLKEMGANPVLTRDRDVYMDLPDRPAVANRIGADAFVSVHFNATPQVWRSDVSGVETYYKPGHELSRLLATYIHEPLAEAAGLPARRMSEHATHLAVLRHARVPAVLLEVAYMSNPKDLALMVTDEFQWKAAEGVVAGLAAYFHGKETGFANLSCEEEEDVLDAFDSDFLTKLTTGLQDLDTGDGEN